MAQHECYSLLLYLNKKIRLKVGKLGLITFCAGYYIYTGCAKKGIEKRILRHKLKDKPKHWHIDYLTSSPYVDVIDVFLHAYPAEKECLVNQWFLNLPGASVPISGFGSSDCRQSCSSHLVYFTEKPVCKQVNEI